MTDHPNHNESRNKNKRGWFSESPLWDCILVAVIVLEIDLVVHLIPFQIAFLERSAVNTGSIFLVIILLVIDIIFQKRRVGYFKTYLIWKLELLKFWQMTASGIFFVFVIMNLWLLLQIQCDIVFTLFVLANLLVGCMGGIALGARRFKQILCNECIRINFRHPFGDFLIPPLPEAQGSEQSSL